jgi:hypothetical protein
MAALLFHITKTLLLSFLNIPKYTLANPPFPLQTCILFKFLS